MVDFDEIVVVGSSILTPSEQVHRFIPHRSSIGSTDTAPRRAPSTAPVQPCATGSARRGQPARLGRDGPVCGLLERSRHAHPMHPRRSWLRNPIGRRLPVALTVPAGLASEAVSSKKRPGRVNASPVDGSLRLDFAGAPHRDQYHCSSDDRLNRQVLLHLPVSLSSRPARPTDDSLEHITIGRSHIARGWPWPCRPAERTSSEHRGGPPALRRISSNPRSRDGPADF